MIKITFLNVGQGDTILIEWLNEQRKWEIGIVDCNIVQSRNPALDYIKKKKYEEINFCLLSHPHYDHYSGFPDLLGFCEVNQIFIKKFFLTNITSFEYFKMAVKGAEAVDAMERMLLKINELQKRGRLGKKYPLSDVMSTDRLTLGNHGFIKVLSPSMSEIDKFISKEYPRFIEEEPDNNSFGNWLSSILKIYAKDEDWFVLLSSDAESSALKRIAMEESKEVSGLLLLAQCPHHGAKSNFYNSFWRNRKIIKNKTVVAISVGPNHYGHPSKEVIQKFRYHKYQVMTTSATTGNIYGLEDLEQSEMLDYVAPKVIDGVDLSFEIKEGQITN